MAKLTDAQADAIYTEATQAAREACAKALAAYGHGGCGFAWVSIKPARGAFVGWLKAQRIGGVDSYAGGYSIWDPAQAFTQSENAKLAGAAAFVAVLAKHGIKSTPHSRAD